MANQENKEMSKFKVTMLRTETRAATFEVELEGAGPEGNPDWSQESIQKIEQLGRKAAANHDWSQESVIESDCDIDNIHDA